ncbi:outer membrane beta-barrel protein [Aliiglaciecola lipolytica]|uniref:Uncharacterized protein n=1 Tax=Aliiglaciecola lipolytica E3 TaxID=1127673 RepID=K6YAZ6_9ALTE|nr:outer membrane beta-barrel protein [Aliiglaciecola lipolytica]GAC13798.1 hypothetical protein GLIP_1157 [Aliiglaciecola lipolytica E3]
MDVSARIAILTALLVSQPAVANSAFDDVRVISGVSLGYSNFSFPEKLDHEISFPSLNVPIIFAVDKWQLSANLQTTLKDADISEEEDVGKASRNDLDITLGYQLSSNWTVFGGYKYGKTKIQFTPRDIEDDEELSITNESYGQKGPFIGVGYHWRFEKAGSLSFSVAYAKLNATNDFSKNTDEEEADEAPEFDDLTGTVTGDTKGFSYSMSWTMPLSTNLLFQTRLKINDYQQDIFFEGNNFEDIDETFTSLHVGLAYVF